MFLLIMISMLFSMNYFENQSDKIYISEQEVKVGGHNIIQVSRRKREEENEEEQSEFIIQLIDS